MKNDRERIGFQTTVGTWGLKDIQGIFENLEHPNWAPWLEANFESLAGRAVVFPEGQLLLKDASDKPLASLSMNRVRWNGNNNELPSWDEVAGDPTTYENTYNKFGNSLVMMSMNVHPEHQGRGYPKLLIEKAKLLAIKLNAEYLIGSFRPNEYGNYKLEHLDNIPSFEDYVYGQRSDGLPIDSWLRNLARNGMQSLQVDHQAMTVEVPLSDFHQYRKEYNPDRWVEVSQDKWECGEVGSWTLFTNNNSAIYRESNLWGKVWEITGSQ